MRSVWEVVSDHHKQTKELEMPITVKEVTDRSISAKGIRQTNEQGYPNPRFEHLFHLELIAVGNFLKSLPYVKIERPQNRRKYVFNIVKLARFMKARGFDVSEEMKSYGGLFDEPVRSGEVG